MNPEQSRRARIARCAAGRCTACGKVPPSADSLQCEGCRTRVSGYMRKFREARVARVRAMKAANPEITIEQIAEATGQSRRAVWLQLGGTRGPRRPKPAASNRCVDCFQPRARGSERCGMCKRIAEKRAALASGVPVPALCESCWEAPREVGRIRCAECERSRLTARRYVEVA